jgi:hypothetical protein
VLTFEQMEARRLRKRERDRAKQIRHRAKKKLIKEKIMPEFSNSTFVRFGNVIFNLDEIESIEVETNKVTTTLKSSRRYVAIDGEAEAIARYWKTATQDRLIQK